MQPDASARYEAYLVCQQRGHTPSGYVTASIPPWQTCKFCGTRYRWTEPQLVESGAPEKPSAA